LNIENKKIVIGSRESRLAVIQSEMVRDHILAQHPQMQVEILTMKTTGDKILNQALEKIGGKGLFVKELDLALMERRSDLSVHSLKDVPMELPEELPLVAFSKREDPRDVLVLPHGKTEIDFSKPIGCSSRRRMIQLKKLYPQAFFQTIRGNVQTRLAKLDDGQYSATILAAAGLKRLGLEHRISRYFSTEEMIPAAGQAILAVQGRAGEDFSFLQGYSDREATVCALCERAFVRTLGGNCSTPVGAFAQVQDEKLVLHALYFDEETQKLHTGRLEGSVADPERTGRELAERFCAES
jgi:hydroxymethylbilane synthase